MSSSIWPPANFDEWPSTRIGALVINGIIILCMIVPWTRRIIFVNSWKQCCCVHNCDCHEFWKAFILGGLLGMFLHFIPCIWWTCDWGEYDGEGVRGAIWFISWPIIGLIILWLECHREDRTTGEQLQLVDEGQQVEDVVAVKNHTDNHLPA